MKPSQFPCILILGALLLSGSGCASLQQWRIDPTGNCFFTRQQSGVSPNTTGVSDRPPTVVNPSATSPPDGSTPLMPGTTVADSRSSSSTTTTTEPSPFQSSRFPGGFGSAVPGSGLGGLSPQFSSVGGKYAESAPPESMQGPALFLAPRIHIAPIDSEIVVVASYLGKDEYLRTNQIVDWSLDGAGHILTYDTGSWCDWVHFDFTRAKKQGDRSARTKTSANLWTIDRGTPDTKDDVEILKGQTWITIKSTREGTSYISALAPSINEWSKRSANAIIHWVDAQFSFPRPTLAPIGQGRELTTIVSRQSNGTPRPGWFVEYEIIGGPEAGFGEARAQKTRIETDINGRASTMIFLNDAAAGTSSIAVRVIRPASVEGIDAESIVESRVIRQIWSSSGIFSIDITKEPVSSLESSWKVLVRNLSARATGATIRLHPDEGLQFVSSYSGTRSVPLTQQSSPNLLQWDLESIPELGSFEMDVVLRADPVVVGQGKYMNVRGEVFPRSSTRAPVITDSGTGSGSTTGAGTGTGSTTPPVSPYPGLGGSTPTAPSTPQYKKELTVGFYIGRAVKSGDDLGFPPMQKPYRISGENKYAVLYVKNETGRDLKDINLVIHPAQKGNAYSDALRPSDWHKNSEEYRGRIFQRIGTLAHGQQAVHPVGYEILHDEEDVDLIAEITQGSGGGQDRSLGRYSIKVSVGK